MADCMSLIKSDCKNCYKCIRHCPVKSIRFTANRAHIVKEDCILCGECFVVCPQNAKTIVSEVEKVRVLLQSVDPVYVSLAPSFAANYKGVGIKEMNRALKLLGFAGAEETAVGATIVKREYERILREDAKDVIISTCCHSINLLVQKYFPNLVRCLADVPSPMVAHCKDIKKRFPGAKTVFIGPCISKKDEAEHSEGAVDAVLTFGELSEWLRNERITLDKIDEYNDESLARIFPTAGGVIKTMTEKPDNYKYIAIDGVEKCMNALHDIESGRIHSCFVEMNACIGSCIAGPAMEKEERLTLGDYFAVEAVTGKKDFPVEQPSMDEIRKSFIPVYRKTYNFSEEEINEVLRKMGKTKKEDELNCGSCGYDTCREKAAAILAGKAEISMCLPYLKEKAESFSDCIVNNTPNGLFVLNEKLEVQQINAAARRIMNIRSASDVLGDGIVRILDPSPFVRVLESGRNIHDDRIYLAEYGRYVEQSIVYDRNYHLLICIMRDVTREEDEKEKKERMSRKTIEVADKVVDKQMRIVQEVASLLGETAAETKIALSKLKESITDE